jgi:hypothetical protein
MEENEEDYHYKWLKEENLRLLLELAKITDEKDIKLVNDLIKRNVSLMLDIISNR